MEKTELLYKIIESDWGIKIAGHLFAKAKNIYTDISEKERIQWGNAFDDYLKKTFESYSKTKTLLYRDVPRSIYEFYECISLKKDKNIYINSNNINNILKEGNKILITGTGGIGKTIMLKHFYLNAIETTSLIPILIELRKINGSDIKTFNLKKYIIHILKKSNLNLEDKYFEYTFKEGYYIFLFDGFDEIEENLKLLLTKEIQEFALFYDKNFYIISSRPSNEFISWNDFLELKSLSLNKNQALSLINKLYYDEKVKDKFCYELKNGLFEKYKTFASIPLLLIIMFLTFEDNATIPNKINEFYEQAFSVLFHKHDATKGTYSREIQCKLGYEDFKKAFSYFCFRTYFESKYNFTYDEIISYIYEINKKDPETFKMKAECFLHDLLNSVCVILEDGLEYKFVHRSFQEYFAALYARNLSDEKQKMFFSSYFLNNIPGKDSKNFYQILYEIQKERFVINILEPFIESVENEVLNRKTDNLLYKMTLFEIFFPCFEISLGPKNKCEFQTRTKVNRFSNTLENFNFLIKRQFNNFCFFSLITTLKKEFGDNIPLKLSLEDLKFEERFYKIFERECLNKLQSDWNNLKNTCYKYSLGNESISNFNDLLKQL